MATLAGSSSSGHIRRRTSRYRPNRTKSIAPTTSSSNRTHIIAVHRNEHRIKDPRRHEDQRSLSNGTKRNIESKILVGTKINRRYRMEPNETNIASNIIFVGTKINRRHRLEPNETKHRIEHRLRRHEEPPSLSNGTIDTNIASNRRSSSARRSTSSLDRIKRNEHSTESKGSQTEDQQRHLVQDHRRVNEYGAEPKQANIEPNVETIDLHPTNTETLQSYHVSDSPDVNRVPLKRSTVGKFVTEPFVFLFFLLCAWNTPLVFRENFCYAVKM